MVCDHFLSAVLADRQAEAHTADLVEVVPDPLQLRDKFFDTVRIHDLLLQHTGKDILLLVLPALENLLLQLLVFFLVYPER